MIDNKDKEDELKYIPTPYIAKFNTIAILQIKVIVSLKIGPQNI
jgi:hypothetical protein